MIQNGIVFRVDAGPEEGLGHLQRCITLASYMQSVGFGVWFICRTRQITTDERLKAYAVFYLDEVDGIGDSDRSEVWDARATLYLIEEKRIVPTWIVVDHYGLSLVWERGLREAGYRILVIDDLRTRYHCADIITSDCSTPFNPLQINSSTDPIVLTGSLYALVSSDYAVVNFSYTKKVNRILVTYGATDPTSETIIAIKAIGELLSQGKLSESTIVDIVIGPLNFSSALLSSAAKKIGLTPYFSPPNLSSLMLAADLVVTAGGNAMTEALALLKTCVVTATADNQLEMVSELSGLGLVNYVGKGGEVNISKLAEAIFETEQSIDKWSRKIAAEKPIDCLGAMRVTQKILEFSS